MCDFSLWGSSVAPRWLLLPLHGIPVSWEGKGEVQKDTGLSWQRQKDKTRVSQRNQMGLLETISRKYIKDSRVEVVRCYMISKASDWQRERC